MIFDFFDIMFLYHDIKNYLSKKNFKNTMIRAITVIYLKERIVRFSSQISYF